jgi:uracil-DNA glycosylase
MHSTCSGTLTANVQGWEQVAPSIFPLPHPSPRNNRWLKANPWFVKELLPQLRRATSELFGVKETVEG